MGSGIEFTDSRPELVIHRAHAGVTGQNGQNVTNLKSMRVQVC